MTTAALFLGSLTIVSASPLFGLDTKNATTTTTAADPSQQLITCYALPYGGIGSISHALTYYTILCLAASARPLMPWKMMKHGLLDEILAAISIVASSAVAIYTIVSCRRDWPFLLVAVWKLSLSVTLGVTSLHRSHELRKDQKAGNVLEANPRPVYWGFLTVPGVVVGMTGLIGIISRSWNDSNPAIHDNLRYITIAFAAASLFAAIAQATGLMRIIMAFVLEKLLGYNSVEHFEVNPFLVAAYWLSFLGAFYSDWILGTVMQDLVGTPSSDNGPLYWGYFAAKRLPMFFQ